MTSPCLIYKILVFKDWQSWADIYRGSAHDLRDGFIHFSTATQLQETLNKFYGKEDEVVIAEFDASDLAENLQWDTSREGEKFPHLYGNLKTGLAKRHWHLSMRSDGHKMPEELSESHA